MSAYQDYMERFRQYPPLMRWLLVGALGVAFLLIWSQLVWETAKGWDARAAEYAEALRQADIADAALPIPAIRGIGPTELIGNEVEGTQALSDMIIEVLNRYQASGRDVQPKPPTTIRQSEMPKLFSTDRPGQRAVTEVRFEATPQDAFGVIAELESSAAVETVSKVQMMKPNDARRETVTVTLTVEAWVSPGAPATRPSSPPPASREEPAGAADTAGVAIESEDGRATP